MRRRMVVVVAAWALACGGAGRNASSGSGGPVPLHPDAGVFGGGGAPDAGGGVADGGDAGVLDGGGTDAGTPDGGTSADAGTDAGSSDGGTSGRGTDAGVPDGGTPGDEDGGTADAGTPYDPEACRGLVPTSLPDPIQIRLTASSGNGHSCLPGTSDGAGNVVLGSQNEMQPHDTPLHFYSRSGAELGTYTSAGYDAIPQSSGYVGLEIYGGNYEHDVLALAPDGSVRWRGGDEHRSGFQAEDPLGGMIVWAADELSASGDLQSFSSNGSLRWSVPLTLQNFLEAIGVDREGNILLVSRHQTGDAPDGLDGQWVAHDGTLVGGDFAVARIGDYRPSAFRLFPQVGSGLFLWQKGTGDATWLRALPARSTHPTAPPAWLVAHDGQTLHMIRGGRAYAFLPPPQQLESVCTQHFDVVAGNGQYCGQVELPISFDACLTGSVSVGYDGTVLQRLPTDQSACSGSFECACDWRFWTHLLG